MGYGLGQASRDSKAAIRTVILASADAHFRARLRQQLTAMRWRVREAGGGAEAMLQLEAECAEAMVLDSALPDLEVGEFARQMRRQHPVMDLLRVDAGVEEVGQRSPRRNELLHALRQAQEESSGVGELPGWAAAGVVAERCVAERLAPGGERGRAAREMNELLHSREKCGAGATGDGAGADAGGRCQLEEVEEAPGGSGATLAILEGQEHLSRQEGCDEGRRAVRAGTAPLPEMVGESAGMLELARLVRLVAPRSTSVLIEGDTGKGKELLAKAVHLLRQRATKSYVVLNSAGDSGGPAGGGAVWAHARRFYRSGAGAHGTD